MGSVPYLENMEENVVGYQFQIFFLFNHSFINQKLVKEIDNMLNYLWNENEVFLYYSMKCIFSLFLSINIVVEKKPKRIHIS